VRRLAAAGIESLTYFETTGWRGVLETLEGSPLPERFPSVPGQVFPMYHVLADLAEVAEGPVDFCDCSHPLQVEGLSASRLLLLVNLTPRPQQVTLSLGDAGRRYRVRFLDETTAEMALRSPEAFRGSRGKPLQGTELHLAPYAVARIESDDGRAGP
jgi:hypothetical protein